MPLSKKKVNIIIRDEVNCIIAGLAGSHINWFYDFYGRDAENYFFSPKYKIGAWDGKIRFFKKSGQTYVYLLEEIIPKLIKFGYAVNLEDKRSSKLVDVGLIDENYFSSITDDLTDESITLRYYQVEAVNALTENGGGIAIAGTGSGKTITNAVLVDLYGQKGLSSMTIVPNRDLIVQTKLEFARFGLDVGEYSGSVKDINHTHVVSTWQALKNTPTIIKNFQVVVVDECHGLKASVLSDLLLKHGASIAYRFGLTGTLPKSPTEAMSVRVAVGEVVHEIYANTLIKQDFLANLHIDIVQLIEDLNQAYDDYIEHEYDERDPKLTYNQFRDSYFPEWQAEKKFLSTYEPRIRWIADTLKKKVDERGNLLCLVNEIEFGKKIAENIEDAIFVYGKDKQKARKEIYDLFGERDDLMVIATIQIASTGLNIKRLFNVVYVDIGKSFIRTIQTIGRGLRKAHDKDFVTITDICSDLKYSRKHLRERVAYYKEAKYPYKKQKINYE